MPATLTATASNTVTYTNDGATTIAATTYYNLTVGSASITAARTYTLANNATVSNVCTITGNSGGGYNAKLDPTSSYTLTLSGTGTPLVLTNANSIVNTAAGTVAYTAAGSTNITSTTYNNLTLGNSSGTDTAAGAIVVNTGLTTTSGGIFDMSTYQLTGGFTPTNGGTLKTSYASGTNVAIPTGQTWAGTVQFALATGAQYCPAGTFTTLTFSNSSNTDTAAGAITATTLNTTSAGTLAMGANNLTVTTLSNSGLITVSTGSMFWHSFRVSRSFYIYGHQHHTSQDLF